jgi:serine protease Do
MASEWMASQAPARADAPALTRPAFALPGILSAAGAVSPALAALADRAAASVVQIEHGRHRGRGGGGGVIWSAGGLILTNNHVVAHARGQLIVELAGGARLPARIVDREPALDLALLEVAERDLPAAAIGDSRRLRVGELVFAIGHPWGQRGVLTAGIVSARGTLEGPGGRRVEVIHTDARLRPGNSGGPLLNAAGEVIGLNAMIFGGDLAVAIPSHVARAWLSERAPVHFEGQQRAPATELLM